MRRFLSRLTLAVLVPALLLVGAEAFLRYRGYGYPTTFLVQRDVQGQPAWVDNPFFGYRFFPARMARLSAPLRIEAQPAPTNLLRVVVLGESAAMGEPQPAFGLARQLERLAQERAPGRQVEVINAAMTAINSHAIREIVRDLAPVHPAAYVIYMGNNEVVGPYGPGTVFAPLARFDVVQRLRVLFTRTRLSQWLRDRIGGVGNTGERWGGMEMFLDRQVAVDDARLAAVRERFRSNLIGIVDEARRQGARVVLCNVAVNLADQPPFAGAEALTRYHEAEAREQQGDLAGAGRLYAEARDLDTLRFRADSALQQIIRDVAARYPSTEVARFDAEQELARVSDGAAPGQTLFLDHVHLTTRGSYLLACGASDALLDLHLLPRGKRGRHAAFETVQFELLHSGWNDLEQVEALIERRQQPPFLGQEHNGERVVELILRRNDLRAELLAKDLAPLQARFEAVWATRPDDLHTRGLWPSILLDGDRFPEAESAFATAVGLLPHRYDLRGGWALALGYLGRETEGLAVLRDVAPRDGFYPAEALLQAARGLARSGKFAAALRYTSAVREQWPGDPQIERQYAQQLAESGRRDEAVAFLRAALAAFPGDFDVMEDLGVLLALQRQPQEANELFLRALALPGARAKTSLAYAMCLLTQGRVEEALVQLRAARAKDSHLARAWFEEGRILARSGRGGQALERLEQAVELEPWQTPYLLELARLLSADDQPMLRDLPRSRRLTEQATRLLGGPFAPPLRADPE